MAGRPEFAAHTPPEDDPGHWHELNRHLLDVAASARQMAGAFQGGDLAEWLGLWHDLGKFNTEFQDYLDAEYAGQHHTKVPHARWGAVLAYLLLTRAKQRWEEVALPILAHHAGLDDAGRAELNMSQFLADPLIRTFQQHATGLPSPTVSFPTHSGARRELAIRMAFSALVDADFLDTERHFNPSRANSRRYVGDFNRLWARLERKQRALAYSAKNKQSNVYRVRQEVYKACVDEASGQQGVYRLTVPTGGGKTMSGMAFAIQHAMRWKLRRVVVAIPYTSIIDQNARVYRGVFGSAAVLEHHSQVAIPDGEDQDLTATRLRLATENWDSPIVITTTVQLFESLLGNSPGKTRKLHNIANSVIVLDEVQTLPPGLLEPTMDVLRDLVANYGVSVVLSTATQPALEATEYSRGISDKVIPDIVADYPRHFRELTRVDYERKASPCTWEEIASELLGECLPQVLVVLNARRDALTLLDHMKDAEGIYHLSTLLCGAHRKVVLAEVQQRLMAGLPVRLISTQVIEAGVDIDFPVVYRAMGPLDRIVQAAGRCNREGSPQLGRVVIFEPSEGRSPRGNYQKGAEQARFLLWKNPPNRLHAPDLYREYFNGLFANIDLDEHGIQSLRDELNYPEVARLYRLIDEDTVPVIVPYENALKRLADWQSKPSRAGWQRLQPYVVNLYEHEAKRLEADAWLELVTSNLYRWRGNYDEVRGLAEAIYDPADLYA